MKNQLSWRFALSLSLLFSVVGLAVEPPEVRAIIQPMGERRLAPTFGLKDGSGKTVRLGEYRRRVVLVNFWATTCGGCVKEMPWFMEFSRTYKGKGLSVLGLSMEVPYSDLKSSEEGWQRVKPFVLSKGVNYPVLMAEEAAWKEYSIGAMPATFLVDRQGRIAATYVGVVDRGNIEANIRALLKEPTQ